MPTNLIIEEHSLEQPLYQRIYLTSANCHLEMIRRILTRLNEAKYAKDLDLPGYRLHALKGQLSGFWSVTVQSNWRIIFRFENTEVLDVDYLDYH